MATIDLNELRKEIEIDRKNLAEKEAVLRYLEIKEGKSALSAKSGVATSFAGGVIQLDQLIVPASSKRTLADDVEDVVKRFGDQEFSVAHVDIVMQQQDIKDKSGEYFPRSRLSTALGNLEEEGLIDRVFKGAGNVPHRYKLKKLEHELA